MKWKIIVKRIVIILIAQIVLIISLIAVSIVGMKIMMMSGGEEWNGKSEIDHDKFHEVDIEDLLPREKIQMDMEAIGALLRGKRILITGAAGSIGSEMVRQVATFDPAEMILIDQAETPMHDIRLMMAKDYPLTDANRLVVPLVGDKVIIRRQFIQWPFHLFFLCIAPGGDCPPMSRLQRKRYRPVGDGNELLPQSKHEKRGNP